MCYWRFLSRMWREKYACTGQSLPSRLRGSVAAVRGETTGPFSQFIKVLATY